MLREIVTTREAGKAAVGVVEPLSRRRRMARPRPREAPVRRTTGLSDIVRSRR